MKTFCIILTLLMTILLGGCTNPGEDEYNKGIEAQRANKIELAQNLFKQALTKDPTLAEAYINLGYIHIQKKQFDKAWRETETGLNILQKTKKTIVMGAEWQDQAAIAYNNLAKIAFNRALDARASGDKDKQQQYKQQTLDLLNKAAKLDPENDMVQSSLKYVQRWPE